MNTRGSFWLSMLRNTCINALLVFAFVLLLTYVNRPVAYLFYAVAQAIRIFSTHDVVKLLGKIFRTREIFKPEGLYLRRYYLSPRWSWMPFQIFLHNIRLDDDRNMHDHPWDFWSFILKGCYREWYMTERTVYGDPCVPVTAVRLAPAGTLLRNKAEHIHRVEIVKPVWSLVITGRARRLWGFWPSEIGVGGKSFTKFVDAATFLNEPGVQDMWPEDRLSDKAKRRLGIPVATKPSEISERRPAKPFDESERGWFTDSAKIPDERQS